MALLNQHRQKALNFENVFIKLQETELPKQWKGCFKCKTFQTQRKLIFEFAEANNFEDSFDRTARWWEFFGSNRYFKTANLLLRSPQSGKSWIQQGSS